MSITNNPKGQSTDRGDADVPSPVSSAEYDDEWIRETWGWDTPEDFIRTQGRNLRPRMAASLKLAALRPGIRILDIGCGRGELVLHCARNGIHAVGVDYSQQAVDLAQRTKATHSPHEQEFMQFVCGDASGLPEEEPFDRIFMLDLVEHLTDHELTRLFTFCRNSLKSGGALIIHTLPNKWVYDITYKRLLRMVLPRLPENPRSIKEMAIHINEMTITHLAGILNDSGFEHRVWLQDLIVEQARWHFRQPLSDSRGKIYRWLANPLFGIPYKLLCKTPLRLLCANEMFAVAWKRGDKKPITTPFRLTEPFVIAARPYLANR